jgi:predicted TIM-barrel fold metal-dependent hydrolase
VDEKALIVSSDGHAMPHMPDYRPYLPSSWYERFDDFLKLHEEWGYRSFDPPHLLGRTDSDVVERWVHDMEDHGRLDGNSDPRRRLEIMEEEGIVAEVLFPDFGLPFELYPPTASATFRHRTDIPQPPERSRELIDVSFRAHNRWLADFCSTAPERFVPMLSVLFDDVDKAVNEIRWGKEAGFKGVLVPTFSESAPLFDARFDPIWSALEELELPANSHIVMSATTTVPPYGGLPSLASSFPLHHAIGIFRCREVLTHLIWGGVFERHPNLRFCMTEQGSGWIQTVLQGWDHTYATSYLRRDIRDVVRHWPSEYYQKQCFFGASCFSRQEIEDRVAIGLDKMCLGMDYPHHEGTFAEGGTVEYLRATLGASGTPAADARLMLGENAIKWWRLDKSSLRQAADRVGPSLQHVLSAPDSDLFPRGDVRRPSRV